MSIEGTFKIEIKGRPVSRETAIHLRNICTSYVQAIDPDNKIDETFFSDIAVIYIWSGIPQNFRDSQLLLKFLDEKIGDYFLAWKFTFEMNMKESED